MDPHRELGLQRGASEADVKAAYRKLVLQYHPDRHINSSAAEAAAAAHRFKVCVCAMGVGVCEGWCAETSSVTSVLWQGREGQQCICKACPLQAYKHVRVCA